jgi:hypothetical protein
MKATGPSTGPRTVPIPPNTVIRIVLIVMEMSNAVFGSMNAVLRDAKYYLFARVNCPSANDDSFWVKIDDGSFTQANGLGTKGWEWVKLSSANLKPGEHMLTMTYREDGALLDKIAITTYPFGPSGLEKIEGTPDHHSIAK